MVWIRKVTLLLLCVLLVLPSIFQGTALSLEKVSAATISSTISVKNNSFEEAVVDGKIPGWTSLFQTGEGYTFEVSNEHSAIGENSLHLSDTIRGQSVGLLSEPIAVQPGDSYTGMTMLYLKDNSTASFRIQFYDEKNVQIKTEEYVTHSETSKGFPVEEWSKVDTPTAVAPEGAKYARVVVFTTSYAIAQAYYDDVTVLHTPKQGDGDETHTPEPMKNGSFEEPVVDGTIPGWTSLFESGDGHNYTVTNEQSASGEYSLHLSDEIRGKSVGLLSDPIEVKPGDLYTGTAMLFMKADSTASIRLEFYDEKNSKIQTEEYVTHSETSKGFPIEEWTKVSTPFATAPNNAKYAKVVVYTTSYAIAKAYFDDVSIEGERAVEPIGTDVRNSSFEKPLYNGKIQYWESLFNVGSDYHFELNNEISASGDYSLKIYDQVRNQSVALISDYVSVTPGDSYTGSSKLYLKDGGTASIDIRFYNANDVRIDVGATEMHYASGKDVPIEEWSDIYTRKVVAPDDAVYARMVLYTTSYQIAEAYYDDVTIIHDADTSPAKLSISAPTQITEGETFSVTLDATNVKNLYQMDGNILFDRENLQFSGYEPLGAFATESASVTVEEANGKLNIVASTNPEQPIISDSGIVQLHFKAGSKSGQAWTVLSKDTVMNHEFQVERDQTSLILIGDIEEKLENVTFSEPENLQSPIADTVGLFDGRTGVEDSVNVMYTTVKGIPPVFHVINIDEHKLIRSLPMEGAGDVWSHTVVPNGDVYVAAGGQLWVYSPVTKDIKKVYTHSTENVFWALEHDEAGNVYIATGPLGKIIKYDPTTHTAHDYGRLMGHISQEYVRSIDYSNGYVYGGTSLGEIYKINVKTGEKVEIASPLNEEGYVYDLDIVDDRLLIARFETSQTRYVYNLETEKWEDVKIVNSSSGLHLPKTSLDGKIYMPVNGKIASFDVNTFEVAEIVDFGTGFRGADWVEPPDPELPGVSLVTMNFAGSYMFFNPATGKIKTINNFLPPSPSITHVFKKGTNGKIYITGMQASKAAEYDVFTKEMKLFPMGQAGAVIPYQDKVYFGVYPGGGFEEYFPAGGDNPRKLFNIGDAQDRPISGIEAEGKIFVGSIPDYGELGGAMMVYDPSGDNPKDSYKVHRNIVENQSIISLAYKDGKIFGSTSINGGLSSETKATEAKIFVWDIDKEKKIKEISLDIPGLYNPPAIGGLSIGPDGLLWGAVNGIVFAMDPESLAVIKYKNLFPTDGSWGQWGAYNVEWQNDILYMQLGRRLVAIDPISLDFHYFEDSEAFTIGEDGHLYYSPRSNRTLMYKVNITDKTHPGRLHLNSPTAIKQNEMFEVTLYANQVNDLDKAIAQLEYNANELKFIQAKGVEAFSEKGTKFKVARESGQVTISASLPSGKSLNKDGKIAVLRFKANKNIDKTAISILKNSKVSSIDSNEDIDIGTAQTITVRVLP
ncbi:cohesin domain-containing protein [Bacillus sp. HNG]|uniref:cohesin domain-containing protein n=1 Tax=Bacillus sp. HNG TaxID=2293325 RepID=UPI00115A4B86|nr:cohesin domain-containing protein [Bacillus sp. HNG]